MFPVQIAEPLDGGSGPAVGKTAAYDGPEKERQTLNEMFPPDRHAPDEYRLYSKVLQQLAGQAIHTRYGPQYGHVPGRQAHQVVFILRRMVDTYLRDGLRRGGCFRPRLTTPDH